MEDELLSLDVSFIHSEVLKDFQPLPVHETNRADMEEGSSTNRDRVECECMGECSLCSSNELGSLDTSNDLGSFDTLARSFTEQEIFEFEFDATESDSQGFTDEIQRIPLNAHSRSLKSNLFFEMRSETEEMEKGYLGYSCASLNKSMPIPIPPRNLQHEK